jgi:hypothetical protein
LDDGGGVIENALKFSVAHLYFPDTRAGTRLSSTGQAVSITWQRAGEYCQ